ncbi:MAG: cell division protein FtsZ [Sphingomonas sp.]|jgi:cell division protein FtsZ|uniref:cell division protein FtsZ n=1 Tax=Sphingomonas sp. TaxID=28214 RepID=UPI00356610C1
MAQATEEDGCVTIVGIGGAGGNAVAELLWRRRYGLRLLCANTDMQALGAIDARHRLRLGPQLTRGLGAGADPDIGRRAAEESMPEIVAALAGTRLCIVAAGLGGGTGTGAAPVIARAARAIGAVTIGIAIKPFRFEGVRRARVADAGAIALADATDAMVTVCNEHLFRIASQEMTMRAALAASNAIVGDSATCFAQLAAGPALKRVGTADLRAMLAEGGRTVIGHGERRSGTDRALHAARSALCNPLLESVLGSAQRLIVSVNGGDDLGLFEVEQAISWLRDHVEPGAEIAWGATTDAALDGCVRVGIAATRLVAPTRAPARTTQPAARPRAFAGPIPAPPPVESAAAAARRVMPAVPARKLEVPRPAGAPPVVVHDMAHIVPAERPSPWAGDTLILDGSFRLPDRTLARAPSRRPLDWLRKAIGEGRHAGHAVAHDRAAA